MSSVERCRPPRRCAAGEGRTLRSSPFVLALAALLALAACAGPTPSLEPTEADASEAAAASGDPADDAAGRAAAEAAAASGEASDSIADRSAAATAPERVVAPSPPPPPEPVAEPETPPDTAAAQPAEPEAPPDEAADAAAEAVEEPAAETAEAPAAETPEEPVAAPDMPPPAEEQPSLTAAAPSGGSFTGWSGTGLTSDRPYVVIRFTEDAGDYEPALAEAVRRALERRPNLAFDLVAVTPRAATAEALAEDRAEAQAQAAAVMQSLADLGIGRDRVTMRAWTGQPTDVNEIRLYIR